MDIQWLFLSQSGEDELGGLWDQPRPKDQCCNLRAASPRALPCPPDQVSWRDTSNGEGGSKEVRGRQTEIRQGVAADLRGGGHTYLRDKIVIKQTDDVLLLDLLGRGEFWRWRHGRTFPQLHASEHTATAHMATPRKTRDRNQVSKIKPRGEGHGEGANK